MASLSVQNKKGGLYPGAIAHVGRVVVVATGTVPFEAVDETRTPNEKVEVLVASVPASPLLVK